MRIYIPYKNTDPSITAIPLNQTLYWLMNASVGDCDANEAVFLALSHAQKYAQSSTTIPATATAWVLRGCSGSTNPGTGQSGADDPAVNQDFSSEENEKYYDVPTP